MAIGWHFLYEGIVKCVSADWSSEGFLTGTIGFTSGFYHWLAASPERLQVVDVMNVYGLMLIGIVLFLGIVTRWASLGGFLLLVLYYFAYPPFGISLLGPHDGSVFIVNKIFIEAAILACLFFIKEKGYGIDNLIAYLKIEKEFPSRENEKQETDRTRREAIKNLASLPILGALSWSALKTNEKYNIDATTGATIQINRMYLSELKGSLPKGKIENHELSRLVMGGNLIGGWAHARDLLYAESLFKAYNTEKKIFETLMLCEQAGINCINIGYPTMSMMVKYRKVTGSKIKLITQVGIDEENKQDIYDNVTRAIDNGADILQLQGAWCDFLVRDNRLDIVAGMMDRIKSQGYTAGLASHTIDSLIICEENGIIPDYYMKTMHHDNYWSAHPRENRRPFEVDGVRYVEHDRFHDNCFCLFPDRTVEFVNRCKVPVMGFKVLAAGAIPPEDGFRWAFENGADFICVGMFDFQVVNDVNICIDTLNQLKNREREWYG